jgi:hypothetical protein
MEPVANDQKPKAPTYGQLSQKHTEYDGDLWTNLHLLYAGGWAMQRNAQRFIERAPRERHDYFQWRIKSTAYVNFFARLVGYLTGSLFNESLVVAPAKDRKTDEAPSLPDSSFYEAFGVDCDLTGTDFSQFMRLALTDALVYRRALVQVDLPKAPTFLEGEAPRSLAQEDALGLRRAYVIQLPLESLFDYEKAPDGRFQWCVLHRIHRERATPFADRALYQHEFKVWWMANGAACYAVLRSKPVTKDDQLDPDDELQVVEPERATSFKQIPICELELPEALWVGNQAGPLCQEHFRRRSDLMGSLCRSLVEIPYVKLGPEIPAVHGGISDAQSDPNRGHDVLARAREGAVVIGSEDEIGFASPSGKGHEIARAELKDCREEIFASVNAMALQLENSAAAVGRSGDSKHEDKSATAIILTFLATQTREFAQQVMALVSSARGDSVAWAATGLNTFSSEDREQVLSDALTVQTLEIPSALFQKLARIKVANAVLPNATAREKAQIAAEIHANSHAEEHADPLAGRFASHSHAGTEEEG